MRQNYSTKLCGYNLERDEFNECVEFNMFSLFLFWGAVVQRSVPVCRTPTTDFLPNHDIYKT